MLKCLRKYCSGGGNLELALQGFQGVEKEFKKWYISDMIHHYRKSSGFTLAEVLITLGIIGVVAALTIPTLIANHKKTVVETRLKKFYSTFMNALQISQAENGDFTTWNFPSQNLGSDQAINETADFYNTYFFKYMQGIKKCKPRECVDITVDAEISANGLNYSRYIFSDGSCFALGTGAVTSSNAVIHGWYDYNCSAKPNKAGRDQFNFRMYLGESSIYIPIQFINEGGKLSAKNRSYLLEHCKEKPSDCGALIQYDGWNVSKDYPLRF